MNEYGREVAKKMESYMGNTDSVAEEISDIQNAQKGVEVRGALAAGVKKAFDKSKTAQIKSEEATEITQNLLDDSFDTSKINANFEQRLDTEIANLQPEWTGFKDDVTSQLAQTEYDLQSRGVSLKSYEHLVVDGDWAIAINTAIKELANAGGGKIIIPQGSYVYSDDIHIKENVVIEGVKGTVFIQQNDAQIFFYSKTYMKDIEIRISELFNDGALVFDNKYLRRNTTELSKPENVRLTLERVSLTTEFNTITSNKTSFKFYSTRSDTAEAHGAGFAGVKMIDCYASDFNIGIDISTDLTGWVNGNDLNVNLTRPVHAVRIHRGSESLGVDYNIFELYIQCGQNTQDLFIDGGNSNNYDGCTIWDMETYKNARVGTAHLKNTQDGKALPIQRYNSYFRANRYHLIGRFTVFTSLTNHVMISITANENYRVDYFVRGGNNPIVERRNLGSSERLHNSLDFYTKDIGNGEYELYIHNPSLLEVEATSYITSFRTFFPSNFAVYENVENLIPLPIVNYYINVPKQDRVHLATENDFTGITPLRQFGYGITFSTIRGDIPESVRGTPDNQIGIIITNKVGGAGASYNFQEFHVFGSSSYTVHRRYARSDDEWGAWSPPV